MIKNVGIIGFGVMGRSIARACAGAGFGVLIYDQRPDSAEQVLQESASFAGSCRGVTSLEGFADCELIVEAITEALEPKHALLRELDSVAPEAVLVSNSSTYTPSELSTVLHRPGRLVVGHFFNPADLVPLVELVPGPDSAPATVEAVRSFLVAIGKQPVLLHSEIEGFVANRIQAAVLRECFSLVEQGIAAPRDIDTIVKLSLGPRWAACGPFATADLGGLDTFAALTARLFPALARDIAVPERLRALAEKGELGAKTGSGLYQWDDAAQLEAREEIAAYFRLQAERFSTE